MGCARLPRPPSPATRRPAPGEVVAELAGRRFPRPAARVGVPSCSCSPRSCSTRTTGRRRQARDRSGHWPGQPSRERTSHTHDRSAHACRPLRRTVLVLLASTSFTTTSGPLLMLSCMHTLATRSLFASSTMLHRLPIRLVHIFTGATVDRELFFFGSNSVATYFLHFLNIRYFSFVKQMYLYIF
jgi:hypothetical protein